MLVEMLDKRSPRRAESAGGRPGSHIPVLADELVRLLEPQPGQVAIDCTFGGGGHARLVGERLGPAGTLVGIDRDPLAEERFAALAEELSCSVRFIRASYAEALTELAREGLRADLAYFDLGMSSLQLDCGSADSPTPTTRPSICAWILRRRSTLARSSSSGTSAGWRASSATSARSATRARSRARSSAGASGRRSRRPSSSSTSITAGDPRARALRRRPSGQARLPGAADRRQRRARSSSTAHCRSPGTCCADGACSRPSPSTRSRTGASSAS